MANKKITALTSVSTLPDEALITGVDTTRSEGDQNVKMTVENAKTLFGGSGSQNFQQVTDNGPVTDNPILIGDEIELFDTPDGSRVWSIKSNDDLEIKNKNKTVGDVSLNISADGNLKTVNDNGFGITTNPIQATEDRSITYSDASGSNNLAPEDYNANTNTPPLANTDVGKKGVDYKVTVAGTQDFGAGDITFGVDDIIANDGLIWYKKVDNNQSGGTASPTNGGVFDGTLSLDNREFTFYTAYDLSVDGGITFALGGNEVNFGQDYVRLISDGVTPFTTDVNIGDIFNEIPSNLPVDYILDAGEYSMYIWKTPNGVAFSLNPVVNVAPPPTNDFPHANDFVVLMNREISTPTLNGTGVTEIPNLSDVSNPYQNVQNLNQPQDDDVNKYLIFDDDAYMDMPTDVVFNQGNVSLVLSGEFDNNASSLRVLGYHIRGTSTSQNQIIEFRSNQTDIFTYGFKPNAGLVPDSQGSRPINSFVGKGTIIFTYDAANSVATFRYDLENYTATKTIALANNPITQSLLTTLKVTSGVGATCKIKSYGITNRVLTTTEQDDVITYCNNQLGI